MATQRKTWSRELMDAVAAGYAAGTKAADIGAPFGMGSRAVRRVAYYMGLKAVRVGASTEQMKAAAAKSVQARQDRAELAVCSRMDDDEIARLYRGRTYDRLKVTTQRTVFAPVRPLVDTKGMSSLGCFA